MITAKHWWSIPLLLLNKFNQILQQWNKLNHQTNRLCTNSWTSPTCTRWEASNTYKSTYLNMYIPLILNIGGMVILVRLSFNSIFTSLLKLLRMNYLVLLLTLKNIMIMIPYLEHVEFIMLIPPEAFLDRSHGSRCLLPEVKECVLIGGEGMREEIAAACPEEIYLLTDIVLELLKASLGGTYLSLNLVG